MSLIVCPECGRKISDRATFCPGCGLPAEYFPGAEAGSDIKAKPGAEYPDNGRLGGRTNVTRQPGNKRSDVKSPAGSLAASPGSEPPRVSGEGARIAATPGGKASRISGKTARATAGAGRDRSAGSGKLSPAPGDFAGLGAALASFEGEYKALFAGDRYVTGREAERFRAKYSDLRDALRDESALRRVAAHARKLRVDRAALNAFLQKMDSLPGDVEAHNERYVEDTLSREKPYLDTILRDIDPGITLDDEQRRAIVTDDDYCLLVAGAGAGKTTTMAAKVKYLVDKKHINPEEIIVISYTNKAIDELKERINGKLRIPARISTFHSFAFDIVRKFADAAPEVNFSSYKIISEILANRIFADKQLTRNLVYFFGYYFDLEEDIFKFRNLEEYHAYRARQDYETLKSRLGEYIVTVERARDRHKKTLTGEYLRSVAEAQIANFLYLNGLDYEYERVYPYGTLSKKKYTPDFYIKQGEHTAWLEHYALTDGYWSNAFTKEELKAYRKNIRQKRKLHASKHTRLLETWSYYKDGRPLLEHLKEVLEEEGFILKPRDPEEVYRKIVETSRDKYFEKLVRFMINFIEHYKTEGYGEGGFDELRGRTDNPRTLLFLDIAEQVYGAYQAELRRQDKIDFTDMINDANRYLDEIERQNLPLPYKYIVIDEFQDIARQRFTLTKRLSEITDAKVVAVGDDWQSIYAFSGSDIGLFTKFLELMGGGTELKITHTYRNSQELIDIAGGFVQKNGTQIRKRLVSPKHLKNPVAVRTYDDSYSRMRNLIAAVEDTVGEIIAEFGEGSSILIVGRYNFDLYNLCMTDRFRERGGDRVQSLKYPRANITFMTAHSSKGLGFDNVIIFNMAEGKFGFPCQVEDDPIMKLVTHDDKSMPYAEERRLFYVALTRTRNRVYITAPMGKPSRFLVELIKDYRLPVAGAINLETVDLFSLRCPNCGRPLRREFNKNYGLTLWICTNEPEVCDFMTNSDRHPYDIFRCPECARRHRDGYMIVRTSGDDYFFGCTNYNPNAGPGDPPSCGYMKPISRW